MNILLCGGAGYIGTHTIIELDKAGHSVVVVDNFSNSKPEALKRVSELIGKDIKFYKADVLDKEAMDKVFDENQFDAVIHYAGLKSVGESVAKPLEYYHNNMTGTFILLDVMRRHNCKISSSQVLLPFMVILLSFLSPRNVLRVIVPIHTVRLSRCWRRC